jgi:hypothetical protein
MRSRGSKTPPYLVERENQPNKFTAEMTAQLTEQVLALLRLSNFFDLAKEIDDSLSELDHLPLNAPLTDDYQQIGQDHITSGQPAVGPEVALRSLAAAGRSSGR